MQTSFQIIDMTSRGRTHLGDRATFDEAEHFGRWHAARRNIRVVVWQIDQDKRHRHEEEVATIQRDALGRLWTDLTWHGSALV